jgi:hypothetical protein
MARPSFSKKCLFCVSLMKWRDRDGNLDRDHIVLCHHVHFTNHAYRAPASGTIMIYIILGSGRQLKGVQLFPCLVCSERRTIKNVDVRMCHSSARSLDPRSRSPV